MTVLDLFRRWTGVPAEAAWEAPGRVNLIGEHTDYNDGFVLPFAIDRTTTVCGARRHDGVLRVRSENRGAEESLAGHDPDGHRAGEGSGSEGWTAYLRGAAWALRDAGVEVSGADLLIDGRVPLGAGLSSSAALLVASVAVLGDLAGAELGSDDLAHLAWRAENDFVGVPTGTMDQTIVASGRAGAALLFDTRSHEHRHVPFAPAAHGLAVVVIDTGVHRRLADGRYATRRQECEDAATALGVASLRDASIELVENAAVDDRLRRRARHVVTENQRVLEVTADLDAKAVARIGPALLASHASLRDDFEVSAPELDAAVGAAMSAGALGARMTGAGFGGCAIALIAEPAIPDLHASVTSAFSAAGFVLPKDVFAVQASVGARRIDLP